MTMLSLEGRALPTCCIALRARKHFLWWHQGTLGGHFSDHELRKEHTIYTRKPVLHKYYLSIYNSSSVYCEEASYGACFNVEPSHYIRVLTGPCSVIQQCILYWLEPGDMFNSFPFACVCMHQANKLGWFRDAVDTYFANRLMFGQPYPYYNIICLSSQYRGVRSVVNTIKQKHKIRNYKPVCNRPLFSQIDFKLSVLTLFLIGRAVLAFKTWLM